MTDEKIITYGYHHLEIGHPDNQKNYRICGSKTRQAESMPVCHRPAGWGTSHPGVGKCKLHGGCSPSGPDHPNWRGGRYANQFRGRLRQHYENQGISDENPMDLVPELQVQRTILAMALQSVDEKTINQITSNSLELVDEQSAYAKVGNGGATGFDIKGVPMDNARAEFLSTKEVKLISELANDVVDTVYKIHKTHTKNALTKAEMTYLVSKIKQGMEIFVPSENREAFISWLKAEIPESD